MEPESLTRSCLLVICQDLSNVDTFVKYIVSRCLTAADERRVSRPSCKHWTRKHWYCWASLGELPSAAPANGVQGLKPPLPLPQAIQAVRATIANWHASNTCCMDGTIHRPCCQSMQQVLLASQLSHAAGCHYFSLGRYSGPPFVRHDANRDFGKRFGYLNVAEHSGTIGAVNDLKTFLPPSYACIPNTCQLFYEFSK